MRNVILAKATVKYVYVGIGDEQYEWKYNIFNHTRKLGVERTIEYGKDSKVKIEQYINVLRENGIEEGSQVNALFDIETKEAVALNVNGNTGWIQLIPSDEIRQGFWVSNFSTLKKRLEINDIIPYM